MKKLLSFVIALAMVIALVPMSASAEEVKVLAAFTTFNELKELIANAGSESEVWYYEGSEDLVITEDITLPENVMLQADASSVVAAEGTTLTNDGDLRVQTLIVNGEVVNNNYIFTAWSLEINGILNNNDTIKTRSEIINPENLHHSQDGVLVWWRPVYNMGSYENSMEQFMSVLDTAAAESDVHVRYQIDITGSTVFNSDIQVPANVLLCVYGTFTVPAGCTLSVDGSVLLEDSVLNIEGKLSNNGIIEVYHDAGSQLQIAENGAYEGKGKIYVWYGGESIDVQDALPGLDISQFSVMQEDMGWYLSYADVTGGSSNVEFSTFAELKELLQMTEYDYVYARYVGEEPLVIEEDLTIPEDKHFRCTDAPLVVAEGVTLTINTYASISELTVNGKLVNNGELQVFDELSGSGSFENTGCLEMYFGSTAVSMEQITHTGNGYIQWICLTPEVALMAEAAQSAAADPDAVYYIILDTCGKSATLDSDMTVPENTVLTLRAKNLTIPAGNTLTVNGELGVNCTLNMEGTLVNDGYIMVDCSEGMTSGLLNMEGTYTGEGDVCIYRLEGKIDVETAAPGLDVSYFSHVEETDTGWYLSYADVNGGGSDVKFSTFAELKALLQMTEYDYIYARYVGKDPLVIEESLALHDAFLLESFNAPIVVPEGVSLTVENTISADELVVNGVLVNNMAVFLDSALTVNGTIQNNGKLQLSAGGTLTNAENITYGEYGYFCWRYDIHGDVAELVNALNTAGANYDINTEYEIHFYGQDVTFDTAITVPVNTWLTLSGGALTVPEGITLSLDGSLSVMNGPLVIEGTVYNNGAVDIAYSEGGLMQIAETGAYEGKGEIYVWYNGESIDVQDALPGMDLNIFSNVVNEGYCWWLSNADTSDGEPTEGEFVFAAYEGLVALLEEAANYEYLYAEYVGEGPLVIGEDLTIPENVVLDAAAAEVTVPENVKLTVEGALYAGYLTVDGAVVNNWNVSVIMALTVNGTFENNYILEMFDTTELTGEDRITYGYVEEKQTYAQTHWYMGGSTVAELAAAVETAKAAENPNYRYNITFADENGAVLTENLTVPANAQLALAYGDFTVAEGSTLTVDGILYVQNRMFVEGTLVNNAGVVIYAQMGSSLNLAQGGTYKGPGVLDVWVNEQSELETAITGLDLSAFDAAYYEEYREWVLTPKAEPHTHEWGEGVVTTPAACTTEGVLTYTCECGETKTEAIAATGHSFGEWVTVVEPTTEAEGKAERKCQNCEEVETKVLDKLESELPKLGDVNNDGRLNAKDATLILRYSVKKYTDYPDWFEQIADVNDDGRVNAKDATLILRFVVNKADIPGWEK